jgi:hypothetical protein
MKDAPERELRMRGGGLVLRWHSRRFMLSRPDDAVGSPIRSTRKTPRDRHSRSLGSVPDGP